MRETLNDIDEFFDKDVVLHSDVNLKVPLHILENYIDKFETIDKYLEDLSLKMKEEMDFVNRQAANSERFRRQFEARLS